jgi:hypothetical protein
MFQAIITFACIKGMDYERIKYFETTSKIIKQRYS